MSFLGTVGVVAQQGNQGAGAGCTAAPTGVSMATTSSGNYDDACIVYSINLGSSSEDGLDANTGSGFAIDGTTGESAATIGHCFCPETEAQLNNNSGVLKFGVKAYIRETSLGGEVATSWVWVMKALSYDDTNSSAITGAVVGGTASTSQDATSSGTGEYAQITHASGGRGYLQMYNGDFISFNIRATATNACGAGLAAPDLHVKIEFS